MSAQTDVKKEFHYKNLEKYLNEAIELIELGDFIRGTKKLTYAQKSVDKLIDKGFEVALVNELAQIKACEQKIANPESNVVLSKTSTKNNIIDIRSATRNLTTQTASIKSLFDYDPAYANDIMPDKHHQFAKKFNRIVFLEKCQALQAAPEILAPKYKRQLKEVQAAENFVKDLDASAKIAGVFAKIEDMMERMEDYKGNAEIFQRSTTDYLKALMQLMSNNSQLEQQYNRLSSKGNAIVQEKVAAANATAAAEQKRAQKRAAEKTAAEKAANGLPIAGLRDAALESEFKQLGQRAIGNNFTIERIIITASKWGVTKDAIGRAISRSMITYAIGKDSNGQCYKKAMTFTQNASGGSYGNTFYDSGWAYPRKVIDCNLLK